MAAEQAPPMGDMDTPDLEVNLRHDVMRHESIIGTLGNEGRVVPLPKSHTGTSIGVFTSGGDSQGMNAAVRAVVRMGLYLGCEVYMIEEGYQGMVDGGDCIRKASWADVSGIIERGGTVIGSARCQDFRERKGRLTAARNLVKNGITNLVCIGGDGSLTGANLFRNEWGDLLDELYQNGDITIIEMSDHRRLNIVGMVGSIDNDFCGTDMTIGTDTALHRIIEAVDAIATTGTSHQRVFVLEVMGRHCGYLALVAAMACEADFVFIPELPHGNEWEDKLCKKLKQERDIGQRLNVILVAEGAIDLKGNSISATYVKDLVIKRLGYDTRITVLGHVQRGGRPSAFDRVLATRMGAESVIALMDAKSDSPAVVIALEGNQIVRKQLMQCVEKTIRVQNAMKDLDFGTSVHARGRSFEANLSIYKILSRLEPPRGTAHDDDCPPLKLAVVAVGAPACGANAAVRSFVRFSLVRGYEVYGIYESLHGLAEGKVKPLCWKDVQGWAALGGSMLGTRRTLPETIGLSTLARSLKTHEISGLVVVGGFEAYQSVVQFEKARKDFDEFKIPMIVIPSTISNNVPGTDFSLGCDTSLNEIVNISDKIKLSASGSKRRVFLIETMGGFCGYLATLSALAGGADAAYINEENFSCDDLQKDCVHLKQKVENSEIQRGLILINEKANSNYTTNFIFNLFSEEGKGCFTTRMNILGHMQQGGSASPFDRNMGTKLGMKAAEHLIKLCTEAYANGNGQIDEPRSAVIVGIMSRKTVFSPVTELAESTDFNKRLPMNQWWLKLRPLLRIMAKHHGTYTADSERTEELSSARPTPRPSPTSSMASMTKNSEFLPVPKLG